MKNSVIIWICYSMLLFVSCNKGQKNLMSPEIKQQIYHKVLSCIEFPPNTVKIYIDTIIDSGFKSNDRLNLVNFMGKKINFIENGRILDSSILNNLIEKKYGFSEVILTNNSILKTDKSVWDRKLNSENAMIISFSKLFKNEFSNDYFFNVKCICGRRCGNEIFVQFKTNNKGELLTIHLNRSVS